MEVQKKKKRKFSKSLSSPHSSSLTEGQRGKRCCFARSFHFFTEIQISLSLFAPSPHLACCPPLLARSAAALLAGEAKKGEREKSAQGHLEESIHLNAASIVFFLFAGKKKKKRNKSLPLLFQQCPTSSLPTLSRRCTARSSRTSMGGFARSL